MFLRSNQPLINTRGSMPLDEPEDGIEAVGVNKSLNPGRLTGVRGGSDEEEDEVEEVGDGGIVCV